ncbi:MAG: DUF1453 family protein [Sphingopyxis terrae]|nr:DUF1453 family protein [Sphingopyxis terrae]
MNAGTAPSPLLHYLIPAGVVLLVLFFRLRSVGKARRLRLERLWILPTFYALLLGFVFWNAPPHGLVWIWCLVALAVGSGLGWMRGKLMQVAVDPDTHELSQTASPAALLFFVALIFIRGVSRNMADGVAGHGQAGLMAVTDILMAFALGFIVFQRVEIALRARRLLAAARAARR